MLFNTIRIVLWLIISVGAALIIKKSKVVRKKLVFGLSVAFCTVMISVFGMFPVENLFVTFQSPESVFHYTNNGEIDEIIYGKESCLVVYAEANNTVGHYIIPKSAKGYKIPNYFMVKKVSHKFDENGLFDVYQVRGTQDYYIFGTVHLNENDNQIDIYNELDEKVESNIVRIDNASFIYFYLHDFSDEYYMIVNGEKVFILD